MGLMMARVGNTLGGPTARIITGAAIGAAATTGTILAGQYANGDDFSKATGIPSPVSWVGGIGAIAGVGAAITGGTLSQEAYARAAWKGGFTLAGAGVGVLASTFLLTPVLRRAMSDS